MKIREQLLVAVLTALFFCSGCMNIQGASVANAEVRSKCNSLWLEWDFWVPSADVDIVSLCLNAGVDVNARAGDGHTALHFAVTSASPEVVELLIGRGANANARNSAGATPLHRAAALPRYVAELPLYSSRQLRAAALDANLNILMLLLRGGASVDARDDAGATPLHFAADANPAASVTLLLLEVGANVNARNDNGSTPLLAAMKWNSNPEVALVLMATGGLGEWDTENDFGETPLKALAARNTDFQEHLADRAKELRALMEEDAR